MEAARRMLNIKARDAKKLGPECQNVKGLEYQSRKLRRPESVKNQTLSSEKISVRKCQGLNTV